MLWLPAFERVEKELREGRWIDSGPPPFMIEAGVPVFDEEALRRVLPELPRNIPPLDRREAVLTLQLELDPLLGRLPAQPRVDRGRFVAGPGESLDDDLDAFDRLLESWSEGYGPVRLRERSDGDELLWFHADERDVFPVVRTGGALALHFEPGFVVELA